MRVLADLERCTIMTEHMYNKATSKQDYETPQDILDAISTRFDMPIAVDLACSVDNCKAPIGLDFPRIDSLTFPWAATWPDDLLFLNPPFKDIEPWAAKCALEALGMRRGRIVMLTPSAVGSNWYAQHCYKKSLTLSLNGRITFVGSSTGFPKDCMLSVYGGDYGFEVWRWKGTVARIRKPRAPRLPKASAASRTVDIEELIAAGKCPECGQPMLPTGEAKRPNEYDHARGCPLDITT